MKKFLFLFFLVIFLTGCSTEVLLKEQVKNADKSTKIQPEEAVEKALSYMNQIFPETRGISRSEYVVTPVRRVVTRSPQSGQEYPDTLYYVINFGDDNGFALMGADRRLPDLLAISDMDKMDLQDTVFNKGFADFMANLSLPYLPVTTGISDLISGIITINKPMLSVSVSKWQQGAPYNAECPLLPEGQAVTGCTPLAIGQIMTFLNGRSRMDLLSLIGKK
ncbi:MAG: C10 family peptidase [Muribaculaceae bacterium]|nr:C10 family peptidase [Muribaculaceae bacterium]